MLPRMDDGLCIPARLDAVEQLVASSVRRLGERKRPRDGPADAEFCDGLGYYLYVGDADNPEGAEVLARFASEGAARQMSEMLKRLAA